MYCDMDGADLGECGGGGWTLVMKTDGTKVQFRTLINVLNRFGIPLRLFNPFTPRSDQHINSP